MQVPLFGIVVVADDVETGVIKNPGILDGDWCVVWSQPDYLKRL